MKEEKFFKSITIGYLVLGIIISVISFINTSFTPDEGYYLAIARDINAGFKYFIDIASPYNPLAICYFTIPLKLGFLSHPLIYFFIWIIMVFNSYLIYKILMLLDCEKHALFGAVFFWVVNFILDGKYIMLEPLSVLFQLLVLLIYFKFKNQLSQIIIGVLVGLSFLSKQYGLFLLLPLSVIHLRNKQIKELILLLVGFSLVIIFFEIWFISSGGSLWHGIMCLLGKGIDFDMGNGTGIDYTFSSYIFGYFIFILFVFPLFNFISKIKAVQAEGINFSFLILLMLSSLLPLFFASYGHYFQYVLPYFVMLSIFVYSKTTFYSKNLRVSFILHSILLTIYIGFISVSTLNKNEVQAKEKAVLLEKIPKGSKVYLDGVSQAFYFTNNYHSINLKYIGYTFPGYFSNNKIISFSKKNTIIVSNKKMFIPSNLKSETIKIHNIDFFLIKI